MSIGLSLNVLQLELSDGITVSKVLRDNLFDKLGYHTTLWWVIVPGLTSYTYRYHTGLR